MQNRTSLSRSNSPHSRFTGTIRTGKYGGNSQDDDYDAGILETDDIADGIENNIEGIQPNTDAETERALPEMDRKNSDVQSKEGDRTKQSIDIHLQGDYDGNGSSLFFVESDQLEPVLD